MLGEGHELAVAEQEWESVLEAVRRDDCIDSLADRYPRLAQ